MGTFRCVYVSCFNRHRFLAEVSTKLQKITFLDNLRTTIQKGNMETRLMTPFPYYFFSPKGSQKRYQLMDCCPEISNWLRFLKIEKLGYYLSKVATMVGNKNFVLLQHVEFYKSWSWERNISKQDIIHHKQITTEKS